MKRCKTCKHWVPYLTAHPNGSLNSPAERAGGFCESVKINESCGEETYAPDMLCYTYMEGGAFWTGPEFGCVHHEDA